MAPLASGSFGALATVAPEENQPTSGILQLSMAESGAISLTADGALTATVTLSGHTIVGGVLSIGSTPPLMVSTINSFPLASVISISTGVLTMVTGEKGPLIRRKAREKMVLSFGTDKPPNLVQVNVIRPLA